MEQYILLWRASPCSLNIHISLEEWNSQSLEMYERETLIALKKKKVLQEWQTAPLLLY